MTAKEAFRLADSILRYDNGREYTTSYSFDFDRDIMAEMATIPDRFIGAAYRRITLHLCAPIRYCRPGRILMMYKDKLEDRDYLARGWLPPLMTVTSYA